MDPTRDHTPKGITMRPRTRCLLAATFLFLPVRPAPAQTTWSGRGADNNWSTSQNWTPLGAPANDGTANVIMAGAIRLTPNIDTPWSINSLTFNTSANAFTIGGSALTIGAGGIINQSSAVQTMNVPVVLGANQTWNIGSQPGAYLLVYGPVNTSGHALTITGGGGGLLNGGVSGSGSLTIALTGTASF